MDKWEILINATVFGSVPKKNYRDSASPADDTDPLPHSLTAPVSQRKKKIKTHIPNSPPFSTHILKSLALTSAQRTMVSQSSASNSSLAGAHSSYHFGVLLLPRWLTKFLMVNIFCCMRPLQKVRPVHLVHHALHCTLLLCFHRWVPKLWVEIVVANVLVYINENVVKEKRKKVIWWSISWKQLQAWAKQCGDKGGSSQEANRSLENGYVLCWFF